ncbi:MAG: 2-succinyl-5-enolpyruvyl-6-hydroxy-3-cyclohexene-1-carboxylic-acid synthase, partial [Myxococcota bacterium]
LICTSGTAPAHYYPAVIEASQSHLPLLVLSADRPLELMDCEAAQTIDQTRLFGSYVRTFMELGGADEEPAALRGLRRRVAQAVACALGPDPGPVHLNVRARKPLEPQAPSNDEGAELHTRVSQLLAEPLHLPPQFPVTLGAEGMKALGERIAAEAHGLIVVGPLPAHQTPLLQGLFTLAWRLGYPILLESTSQLRLSLPRRLEGVVVVDAGEHLLREVMVRESLRPGLILQVGGLPTSGAYDAWMGQLPGLVRVVLSATGWTDPFSSATQVIQAPLAAGLDALLRELEDRTCLTDPVWKETWEKLNQGVWQALESLLEPAEGPLLEAVAVRSVVEALPDGTALLLGNSLPIREVDLYARARQGLGPILSQRGANGIDGLIAGAVGASHRLKKPLVALLGDVTFLHDAMSLSLLATVQAPLVVVVINNGGGRIFELLPVARVPSLVGEALKYWTTPPSVQLDKLVEAFGLTHRRVEQVGSLTRTLKAALKKNEGMVLEVVVDGTQTAAFSGRCRTQVSQALLEPVQRWLMRASSP